MEASDSGEEEVSVVEKDKVVHQSSVITMGNLATIRGIFPIFNAYIVW